MPTFFGAAPGLFAFFSASARGRPRRRGPPKAAIASFKRSRSSINNCNTSAITQGLYHDPHRYPLHEGPIPGFGGFLASRDHRPNSSRNAQPSSGPSNIILYVPRSLTVTRPSDSSSTSEIASTLMMCLPTLIKGLMGYLVDSSSHYILGVGVPALVASTIVL